MAKPLMQAAKASAPKGEAFKKPNIASFIPPEAKDAVDRVVAAGMRIAYSPEMKDELQAMVDSTEPVPKRLADNVTGLLLTLDQQSGEGGIPVEALFPAGMELLGEAAEVLAAAGQEVSQDDYNAAALMMFALIGQKLGGTPDQIMQAAQQAMPGQGAEETGEPMPEETEQPGVMP